MSQSKPTSKPKQFAELLDSKFRIPGTDIRFGIDPIIGLIPGAGDWLGAVASLYFLVYAAILQVKATVILRMLMNILLDVIIGTIPLVGELFDVGWKANLRNARLLEDLIHHPETTEKESSIIVWTIVIFSVLLVGLMLFAIAKLLIVIKEAVL